MTEGTHRGLREDSHPQEDFGGHPQGRGALEQVILCLEACGWGTRLCPLSDTLCRPGLSLPFQVELAAAVLRAPRMPPILYPEL